MGEKSEPSIKLPPITNNLLALIIAMLFLLDRGCKSIDDAKKHSIDQAFKESRWDAAAKELEGGKMSALTEQYKTLWAEVEKLKAAKTP